MTKSRNKLKTAALGAAILMMAGTLVGSQIVPPHGAVKTGGSSAAQDDTALISEIKDSVDTGAAENFDPNVVKKLADTLGDDREISVIVKTTDDGILEAYDSQSALSRYATVSEYADSAKGADIAARIGRLNDEGKRLVANSGVSYRLGTDYNMLMGGFEVVVKAGDYERLVSAFSGSKFEATVSEEYERAESQLVTNDVNVYDTGIFNSKDSRYDGSGTVIAVLDTGLDYTHTAFDPVRFDPSAEDVITTSYLNQRLSKLNAAKYTSGLTAANVYYNRKVPYTYDYADKDADVYPLGDEHGTHVSGIIVGNDSVITGVAPNAQLVSMKVFSDTTSGARWSWILAALEDCVVLGVDVVNMSLGTSSGFTVEEKNGQAEVYESLADHGISLVAAASNDFNSTYGSEKNGNLGLTTNPDSATVGSPGSYESALAVASISGVKTPYLLFNKQIVYFTESSNAASEPRTFVKDLFASADFKAIYGEITDKNKVVNVDYVTISGIGRNADYKNVDVHGKIALVRRGSTTFEEKSRIAQNNGALGVIIYNNVSGDISMTVGSVTIPVCSISQDNGEMLAAQPTGKISISLGQEAGPFMSNFSSWGPTPDLRIKPEITAHGGDIYSAFPGQRYERISGTSMASPNQAGVTALVRQYVKETFKDIASDPVKVMQRVNQIMMSTADIALNTNGLPYSVRKQGAGLANLTKATSSPAFISAFARSDQAVADQADDRFAEYDEDEKTYKDTEIIDKAKIEYGDDKGKLGSYLLKFRINNISGDSLTYDVGAITMTEGISEIKTHQGDQTVTEEGYLLSPKVTVESVSGGVKNGNTVTVSANQAATVALRITLSEGDRAYLDQYSGRETADGEKLRVFANGMYVEGYVTLTLSGEKEASLNAPYLAFYGDWTEAPMFDLDYFATDKDANDDSIDTLDKTLPDAFATMPIGGLTLDYNNALGSYYFVQDPSTPRINADRNYISLTNQEGESGGVNYIDSIYTGMLRGAKTLRMTITDTSTGEVIWTKTAENQRKSYNGGGSIYPSVVDVGFHVPDYDLKNNTTYLFRMEGDLDYPGEQKNKNNVFEFPFVTDFQAPVVTDAEFYTEYDSTLQKDRLYARLYVYDNHYTMSASFGQLVYSGAGSSSLYTLEQFGRYFSQVYSGFNSTSEVVFELTDYIGRLSDSVNNNCFTVALYDYAMNSGIYEIRVPDSVRRLYFEEMDDLQAQGKQYGLTLSPNETYYLEPHVYPETEWNETLVYELSDDSIAEIVNGRLLALKSGDVTVTAYSAANRSVSATLTVHVLNSDEPGFERFDKPDVENFLLTGYFADRAFYFVSNSDRDIGLEGYKTQFSRNATSYALSMYPSERVTIEYELSAYDPAHTVVVFESGNENIAKVDDKGMITAVAEGTTSVSVRVMIAGEGDEMTSTTYDRSITITVKNPYEQNGMYLTSYRGGGGETGEVVIPGNKGYTEIYQYAFSGYDYIAKDVDAGDEISEEDPSFTKIWYYGENQDVKKVVIPEGIEVIGAYAFAGMEGLEEVVLPSTLNKIAQGAFYGCTKLRTVQGLEHVQFINRMAFSGPAVTDASGNVSYNAAPLNSITETSFANIVAIGDQAFQGSAFTALRLPASAQSIGAYAFAGTRLMNVTVSAAKIKLGSFAFSDCALLAKISLNASVIPEGVFAGCSALKDVTLGADVEHIGINAFAGTQVSSFTVRTGNPYFKAQTGNKYPYLLSKDGSTLVYVAPVIAGNKFTLSSEDAQTVTKVGVGAFSGQSSLRSVELPNVTEVEDDAFSGCTALTTATFKTSGLTLIGDYAFAGTALRTLPVFASGLTEIGDYAFFATEVTSIKIPANMKVGEGAFFATEPTSVEIGDGAVLGDGSFQAYGQTQYFYLNANSNSYVYNRVVSGSTLRTLKIGSNVEIGNYAFACHTMLSKVELGAGAKIGEGAFYSCSTFTASMPSTSSYYFTTSSSSTFDIDLTKAVEIGAGAFTGETIYAFQVSSGNVLSPIRTIYYQTPRITSADLSNVTSLGEMAFANNAALKSVTFGDSLTAIPALAFARSGLTSVDLKGITSVGAGAFMVAPITTLDLSKVETVGEAAFGGNTSLTSVTLKEGASVDAEAFYGDTALETVTNLNKAVAIGGGAFAGTGLKGELDISSAKTLGDLAFMRTAITSVKLSPELALGEGTYLGENPFADCPIGAFTATAEEKFHGETVGTYTTDTFDLNENVKVVGGVLYKKLPNGGLGLVTYPMTLTNTEFTVEEGTTRISAYAFRGSTVTSVILPQSLLAIGDKAFYGCNNLYMVTFRSMNAPILEEQYDEEYASVPLFNSTTGGLVTTGDGKLLTHLPSLPAFQPFSGYELTTLYSILKYQMLTFDPVNVFFGANFVDYIGAMRPYLIMIRPSNGEHYDSFVFAQYFGTQIMGAVAPSAETLAAIEAIKALPDASVLTVNDEATVNAALSLYNAIATTEQQALVQGAYDGTNYYTVLSNALDIIEYLKNQQQTPADPEEPEKKPSKGCGGCGSTVIGIGSLGIVAATLIAVGAVCVIRRKKDQ